MFLLDLSLESPAANLALDEALLEQAECGGNPMEVLRLWEFASPVVVVGRGSRVNTEVNVAACQGHRVPILRRSSGGAAIVAGPGCLMYSAVLSYERRPQLRLIEKAHRFVLGRVLSAVQSLLPEARQQGTSDLTLGEHKVSGNSLRCRRTHLMYHGTLLYDFPVQSIGQYLQMPPRQPDYRQRRQHEQFVRNLPLQAGELSRVLIDQWQIDGDLTDWPHEQTEQLVAEKYSLDTWNLRL
jgi:lipoate-protein ligase A